MIIMSVGETKPYHIRKKMTQERIDLFFSNVNSS